MKDSSGLPADTRMMGVVHDALRRDLGRIRAALSSHPYPSGDRRVAIGDHAGWMMRFLHHHHSGEDEGLWPMVRERNPEAGPLLDQMDDDHVRVAPAIDSVEVAATGYRDEASDEARAGLLTAVDGLSDVLLPHLRREEDDAMPVVSATISQAEWDAWNHRYYIKPKTFAQLGEEGHWLLDGLDPVRSEMLVRQVPAVPRLVLRRGFAGRYRRQAARRWGAAPAASTVVAGASRS